MKSLTPYAAYGEHCSDFRKKMDLQFALGFREIHVSVPMANRKTSCFSLKIMMYSIKSVFVIVFNTVFET